MERLARLMAALSEIMKRSHETSGSIIQNIR